MKAHRRQNRRPARALLRNTFPAAAPTPMSELLQEFYRTAELSRLLWAPYQELAPYADEILPGLAPFGPSGRDPWIVAKMQSIERDTVAVWAHFEDLLGRCWRCDDLLVPMISPDQRDHALVCMCCRVFRPGEEMRVKLR